MNEDKTKIKYIKSGAILKNQILLERREQADPAQFTFSSASRLCRAYLPPSLSRFSLSPSKQTKYPSNDIYSAIKKDAATKSDCNAERENFLRANFLSLKNYSFVEEFLISYIDQWKSSEADLSIHQKKKKRIESRFLRLLARFKFIDRRKFKPILLDFQSRSFFLT